MGFVRVLRCSSVRLLRGRSACGSAAPSQPGGLGPGGSPLRRRTLTAGRNVRVSASYGIQALGADLLCSPLGGSGMYLRRWLGVCV